MKPQKECKMATGKGRLIALLFGLMGVLHVMAAAEVWVSDARGNDVTGVGTYESPYKTIQKGVDEVDVGGTVKIQAGTYGSGEEHFWTNADGKCAHTNRVVIGKSITLEGVDGKDVTHIAGYLDPNTTHGNGPAAIRCVAITNEAAANTIIKNLTLCNGGADTNNVLNGYGGAVGTYTDGRSSVCLVDCVISNCVAVMGGGLHGVTAVRCLITDCRATGFGVAARQSNLLNCLIHKNRCLGGNGVRPAVADYSQIINCTITRNYSSLTRGIGRKAYAYNCIVFGNDGGDIETSSNPISETNHCYATVTDAHLLFSTATEDYRLTAETEAVDGGLTEFLTSSWLTSKKITLPAGIAANIDFAGNTIDLTRETCDAGCFQGAVTPGGGRIAFNSTGWIINGVKSETGNNYSYYTPETWPTSVVARPLVANVTNYAYSATSDGYFGHMKNRRYYPLKDGSHVLTPPPNVSDTLRLTPTMANLVVYASPDADPATADGSLAHPFATLQDAVVCITNSNKSVPLILALPGVYDKGGEEIGGVFTRLVLPSTAHFTVRSTDGPERTVIKGGVDESNTGYYAGCGPDAVRCIHISRGTSTVTPSAVQGFTITDGRTHCDNYKSDTDPYRGGGIMASAQNELVSQLLDCIITNCAAVRCGAAMNATLFRCKLYDCHGYGGVTRATRLFSCYVDPSCTLGSAPADASANSVLGSSSTAYFTTVPESTATLSSSLYNSLFASSYPGNITLWGSVTTNTAALSSGKGCAYVHNANFADPANNDWRLRSATPARTACQLPAKDDSAYTTWAVNVAYFFQGDIDGNPLSVTDGKPLPGCWQTTAGDKSVFVDAVNGGLSVSDGSNIEAANLPIVVGSGPGVRPCAGCEVNGVTNLFADTPSVTITAADLEASGYGIVLKAIYGSDLYANSAEGDDSNDGFSPSSPKKTLAAVLALALPGDTVHAAQGDYNEGVMYPADADATALASRAVVPSEVTLVSDEGADVTFITGASATADNADQFGRGTNAVRCVLLCPRATVRGFTLRGGRTRYGSFDSYLSHQDYIGAGACSPAWRTSVAEAAATRVEDCVVSNCVAICGGAGHGLTFDRCRLFRCRAVRGSAVERTHLLNSIVDDMDSEGSSGLGVANWYSCVNSTLGKNFRRDSTGKADGFALHNQWKSGSYPVRNTVVRGSSAFITNAVNCVFSSTDSNAHVDRVDMVNCRKLTDEECALDAEYRPDCATSLLVDAGVALEVGEKDVYGGQRVYNGKLDIGAVEADWRPMYAKLLDGKGTYLAVTNASSYIATNAVDGVAAVELHGGDSLALVWGTTTHKATRRGKVKVTGAGTLTVLLNGEAFAAFDATDGMVDFAVPLAGHDAFAFSFAFEGEGSADLFGFAAPLGTALSIR